MMMARRELTKDEVKAAQNLRALWDASHKRLGLTQDKAAQALDMTQGAVNHFLNGKVPLNYENIHKFAKLLKVTPERISPELCGTILISIEQTIAAAADPISEERIAYGKAYSRLDQLLDEISYAHKHKTITEDGAETLLALLRHLSIKD